MTWQLIQQFEATFTNGPYLHRNSTLGDAIALRIYEDLYELARSGAFVKRATQGLSVLNAENRRVGVVARRGDGSFGEILPNVKPIAVPGFKILRGPIATIEIGIEVKILAKAMIKQIDRVISDLTGQAAHFRPKGSEAVTIGIVGVNHAPLYKSYEGTKEFVTNGKKYKHPIQEATEAVMRLIKHAAPAFDEFLILNFCASNHATPAYDFAWTEPSTTSRDYGAVLVRVSRRYERRYS